MIRLNALLKAGRNWNLVVLEMDITNEASVNRWSGTPCEDFFRYKN
jgi:hypothetical protein